MSKSVWNKVEEDENKIVWNNTHDEKVSIHATRTNPAPRGKWQGWEVLGFDKTGTYFKSVGWDFKKDAKREINAAKFEWEVKNLDRFRSA